MWMWYGIVSALMLGLYDVAKKASVNGNAVLPVLWCTMLCGLLAVLPFALASWYDPGTLAESRLVCSAD